MAVSFSSDYNRSASHRVAKKVMVADGVEKNSLPPRLQAGDYKRDG
jgi:hypothetical protein